MNEQFAADLLAGKARSQHVQDRPPLTLYMLLLAAEHKIVKAIRDQIIHLGATTILQRVRLTEHSMILDVEFTVWGDSTVTLFPDHDDPIVLVPGTQVQQLAFATPRPVEEASRGHYNMRTKRFTQDRMHVVEQLRHNDAGELEETTILMRNEGLRKHIRATTGPDGERTYEESYTAAPEERLPRPWMPEEWFAPDSHDADTARQRNAAQGPNR